MEPTAVAPRGVVLVEGTSDQVAVETLAGRRGRNLDAEGISIVPMGGAQAIGGFLDRFGPRGLDVRLAGLCDSGEEGDFQRGLERAGLGADLTRADMERLGFYVCVADLEDELIRALGWNTDHFVPAPAGSPVGVDEADAELSELNALWQTGASDSEQQLFFAALRQALPESKR